MDLRLIELQPDSLGQFPLLLIKGVEAINTEFEGRRDMQEIGRSRPEHGRGLSR